MRDSTSPSPLLPPATAAEATGAAGRPRVLRRAALAFALGATSLGPTACDRGSHPGQIGQPAPAFRVSDGQHTASLAALRGHVVVLNFWATWCAPCVQELPSLQLMQQELPQVHVLAVSNDTDAGRYAQFLAQHHVTLDTVRDGDGRTNALFGTFRFPETYVIDQNGAIRRKFIGPQEWTSPEITEYLRRLAGA